MKKLLIENHKRVNIDMSANPSFYSSLKNYENRKLTHVIVFGKQMFSLPDFHCAFALL